MNNIISFKEKRRNSCQHKQILIDEDLWQIECQDCGELLDPISYLIKLARKEGGYEFRINELHKAEEKIKNRLRTKCSHCGKMTRI